MDGPKLGQLIKDTQDQDQDRDAIHIAVAPVVAGEPLQRGERVVLVNGTDRVRAKHDETAIGIVDPFLDAEYVRSGERFWLFLFPNTVTGLRHHWSHPAFAEQDVSSAPSGLKTGRPESAPSPERLEQDVSPPAPAPKALTTEQKQAMAWIRTFAAKWNFDYIELIREAQIRDDGCIVAIGKDLHSAFDLAPGDEDLFWLHLSTLAERTFDEVHQASFGWSCSC